MSPDERAVLRWWVLPIVMVATAELWFLAGKLASQDWTASLALGLAGGLGIACCVLTGWRLGRG